MKKSILCIILILTTLFTTGCFGINQNNLEHVFADWVAEEDNSIAIHIPDMYSSYTFLIDGAIIDPEDAMLENNLISPIEYLLLDGELLYFFDEQFLSDKRQEELGTTCYYMGGIYTYNITTSEITKVFSGYYNDKNLKDDYSPEVSYFDRNIYITDGIKITVLNVDSQKAEEKDYASFTIPTANKYSVKTLKDENQKGNSAIKIVGENFERTITFDYMAQRHEYIQGIEELENSPILFWRKNPFEKFFIGATIINDTVYIRCRVYDKDGESNYLLFSYNPETDEFKFLYHVFYTDNAQFYAFARE